MDWYAQIFHDQKKGTYSRKNIFQVIYKIFLFNKHWQGFRAAFAALIYRIWLFRVLFNCIECSVLHCIHCELARKLPSWTIFEWAKDKQKSTQKEEWVKQIYFLRGRMWVRPNPRNGAKQPPHPWVEAVVWAPIQRLETRVWRLATPVRPFPASIGSSADGDFLSYLTSHILTNTFIRTPTNKSYEQHTSTTHAPI